MDIGKEEFRKIGYHLIDQIAEFNAAIQNYPVTRGESSIELSKFIGNENLPENGVPLDGLVTRTMDGICSVLCAAVNSLRLNISPFAVRLP